KTDSPGGWPPGCGRASRGSPGSRPVLTARGSTSAAGSATGAWSRSASPSGRPATFAWRTPEMIGPLRLPPDWTRDPDAREIVAALDRELADIARALRAGGAGQQELLRDVPAPHAAAPPPSVLVGRLARPDGPPAGGVAAGWRCWAEAGGGRFGQIEFRTTRPEVPLPVEVVRVCEEPEPGRLVPDLDVAGAVRATFRVTDPRLTFAGLTDRGPLRLFVRGGRGGVGAFQALLTDAPAAYVFDPDDPAGTIREVALRPVGL